MGISTATLLGDVGDVLLTAGHPKAVLERIADTRADAKAQAWRRQREPFLIDECLHTSLVEVAIERGHGASVGHRQPEGRDAPPTGRRQERRRP